MRKALFDQLMESATQAVEHAKGKRNDLRTTVFPKPPRAMNKRDIVKLRLKMNWSQAYLARGLNVSVKTVQAWEQGLRKPAGPTLKLLEIAENNPDVLVSESIGKV
jgi:putative transcriptional regulator